MTDNEQQKWEEEPESNDDLDEEVEDLESESEDFDSDEEGEKGEKDEEGEEGEKDEEVEEEEEEPSEIIATFEEDLEDDFSDYIDVQLGYADVDWDSLPEKEVDEHESIRRMSRDDLDGLKTGKFNDFQRWAVARAYLGLGDDMAFQDAALPLLKSKKKHPALDYVDIALAIMNQMARRDDFNSAFGLLKKLPKLEPDDDKLPQRFEAILKIQQGKKAEGLELFAQLAETVPDDADFLLSIGEDLCGICLFEEAVE